MSQYAFPTKCLRCKQPYVADMDNFFKCPVCAAKDLRQDNEASRLRRIELEARKVCEAHPRRFSLNPLRKALEEQ